jgi:hypothetical protein
MKWLRNLITGRQYAKLRDLRDKARARYLDALKRNDTHDQKRYANDLEAATNALLWFEVGRRGR